MELHQWKRKQKKQKLQCIIYSVSMFQVAAAETSQRWAFVLHVPRSFVIITVLDGLVIRKHKL